MIGVAKRPATPGDERNGLLGLSPEDKQHLAALEIQFQLVRDRAQSVGRGYHNAVFLFGRPGAGKTHEVRRTLERLNRPYTYCNGRMSPRGLFDLLESNPEDVLVLDDLASVYRQELSLQILMAATGGEPGEPRVVRYATKATNEKKWFKFRGGVVGISNMPLRRDPLADAFASRSVLHEHEPTDEQLAAFMRHLALAGYEDLAPAQCMEVVEFVIAESRDNDYRLDLRAMKKGWQDFRQVMHKNASSSWQTLVKSSMRKLVHEWELPAVMSKKDEIQIEIELVKRLEEKFPGDTDKQIKEFGKSRATFYDRRKQARAQS